MTDNKLLMIRCQNPDCGKVFKMRHPGKSGIYGIVCPHCGNKIRVRIPEQVHEDTRQTGSSDKQPLKLEGDFVVGEHYRSECPHCARQIAFESGKRGDHVFHCPECDGLIAIYVRDKTRPVVVTTDTVQLVKGRLTLIRKGWLNRKYPLNAGKTIVGREDVEMPSDISVKGDNTVSRRSVEIDVRQDERGYSFKLTVLKSTNPVLHNNIPLMEGESVSLNFGDSIILGKTQFRFEKDN